MKVKYLKHLNLMMDISFQIHLKVLNKLLMMLNY